MNKKPLLIILVCSLLLPTTAIASEDLPTETIHKIINDFVRVETRHLPGRVIIKTNQLDSRQTLRPCNQLQPFLPPGGRLWGKFSVGVRCQDEAAWTLYVPVEIEVIANVIHAAQPINMGKLVDTQDIVSKEVDLVRIPAGAVTDPDQVVGKVAVTFLASGQPIRTHQLRAPHIITRGQKIRLTATGAGFAVSTEGEALAAAAEGEVVQIRNHTGRIMSGIARAGGIVEIKQ
ncbi:flagella basal body P-ring formation protein FlgA [Nitrosomonas eutropha]|uniref:flagellar basal body P-ring formation chaperone FlgA n=1 Tax=Nitrosomonas TaxID=914 RepID=UPI000894DAAF|nr:MULTISPECIES: flagellar basal body P-ring formation chaperone FlgA [Nitrosomonas]MXS80421.1 flagellar basal body P-ring formation protein FlgA [Nitrosomonas sp. GH22]SDW95770.1 flagella basal body P-ring formation protein FlgA [Nitrosomonas eutropha]